MGYDQGVVTTTWDSGSRLARDADARFIRRGQDKILEGPHTLAICLEEAH